MDAMEGRLTAPPEIGCSHGSSSSKAYNKDDSSASGTSSPGRSQSSSNSSSASEDSLRRCSVSREDCNSSPEAPGELDADMNRQLLNILVNANNGNILNTDRAMKEYVSNTLTTDTFLQLRRTLSHASCQTDADLAFPPLAQFVRHPSLGLGSTFADIASTSNVTEGVLPLVIKNFGHMEETMKGPIVGIRGVPWRIMVMPRQHVVQKKGTQKCLGFFLQCCPSAYSDSWSCQATAELRLISQKSEVPNFTRKTSHSYTAKENDWGYSCFMTWADILDESQGYIKDNIVKVEVSVKAEEPVNILNHDQFQKKIQEYIRLADMQAERGYLDKAIEVNNSAAKFCKDKDYNCQKQVEVQQKRLIEKKLQESIQRIEKGALSSEDNGANMNALRQALGGGSAARSQKAQKVVKRDVDKASEAARKAMRPTSKFGADLRREMEFRQATKQTDEALKKMNAAKAARSQLEKKNGKVGGSPIAKNKVHDAYKNSYADGDIEEEVTFVPESDVEDCPSGFPSDDPEFEIHMQCVLEHLKDTHPHIQDIVRKTFQQNPSTMSYNEADSFFEEYCGFHSDPSLQDSSVQTDEMLSGTDYAEAIVDAAVCKSITMEDKARKVKRARKQRGKADQDEIACFEGGTQSHSAPPLPEFVGEASDARLDEFEEPASPTITSAMRAKSKAEINNAVHALHTQSFYLPLPMRNVFEYVDHAQDNDNPERPGGAVPGKGINTPEFADHIMKQNINHLICDLVRSGRQLHIGVDSNIFKSFPGYLAHRPLGRFEQRLITNSLNIMSVNCVNFATCMDKVYKFFHTYNMTLARLDWQKVMADLEMAMNGTSGDKRKYIAEPPEIPENPFDAHVQDIDCLMEKAYRKLHDFLVKEIRFILQMHPEFNVLYKDMMVEASNYIKSLKTQNMQLRKVNGDLTAGQRKLEEKKELEMIEIRNSFSCDKDKISELNKQLRDVKKEMKKLERRAKTFETQAVDASTLRERCDRTEEKLSEMSQKYNELSTQHSRDKQSWQDTKSNLIRERQSLESEIKTVRATCDDYKSQAHKNDQLIATERKAAQTTIKAERDRSMKAECMMVEAILESGMRTLDRACDDCKTQMANWEKKVPRNEVEQEIISKNITAWKDKLEEVKNVIATTKDQYNQTISELKKGKQYSTLEKFSVPKPPSPPQLTPLPPVVVPQTQTIGPGPIGSQRRASPVVMASNQFAQQSAMQGYSENHGLVSPSHSKGMQPMSTPTAVSNRGSITPQPVASNFRSNLQNQQTPNYSMPPNRSNSTVGLQQPSSAKQVYPIGVRPPNYVSKNGIQNMPGTPQMKDNIDNAAAALANSANRQLARSPPISMFNNTEMYRGPPQQAVCGNRSWYDPLNAYTDLFAVDPNRWNMGDFGINNRTNTMSPSLQPTENVPVSSAAVGSNRPRQGWFDANNSPISNRPS